MAKVMPGYVAASTAIKIDYRDLAVPLHIAPQETVEYIGPPEYCQYCKSEFHPHPTYKGTCVSCGGPKRKPRIDPPKRTTPAPGREPPISLQSEKDRMWREAQRMTDKRMKELLKLEWRRR